MVLSCGLFYLGILFSIYESGLGFLLALPSGISAYRTGRSGALDYRVSS